MPSPHVHIPYHKLAEHLGFIRERRLNLEIYFGGSALDLLSRDEIVRLREELDYGPSLSFHAPFMDLSPGAVDSRVREATLDRFHQVLDLAEILRPKAVVFHSGYEKWKYALAVDLWLEKSLLTWQPLNRRAEAIGTAIAIENIFEDEPDSLGLLMERMESPNFGVCFDTGHCNLFSRVPLEAWLEALGPHIIELHLHDNDGTADQHRPVGTGSFDFRRFFSLLRGKACIHTLEAHNREDLEESMARLAQMAVT